MGVQNMKISYTLPVLLHSDICVSRPFIRSEHGVGRRSEERGIYLYCTRYTLKGGLQVCDEVVYVFYADAQAEHVRIYPCCNLLFRAKLRVSC